MIRYNIPIGISEFEKIRKNDYYYVDKTELIQALLMLRTCRDYTFYKTSKIWKDACDEYVGIFL